MNPQCTKQEFRAWLENKKPDEIVGTSGRLCACPLAKFLSETRGGRWEVSGDWINNSKNGFAYAKGWQMKFIEWVDQDKPGTRITAKRALKYLR